jgi:hypothetical protein
MSLFSSSPSIPAPAAVKPLPALPKGINVGQSLVRQNRERIRLASGGRRISTSAQGLITSFDSERLRLLGVDEPLGNPEIARQNQLSKLLTKKL